MNRRACRSITVPLASTLATLLLCVGLPAVPALAQQAAFVDGELLVKFDPAVGDAEAQAILQDLGTEVIGNFKDALPSPPVAAVAFDAAQHAAVDTLLDVYWLRIVDGTSVDQKIQQLTALAFSNGSPMVLVASPNFRAEDDDHQQLPNDLQAGQWDLLNGGQAGVAGLQPPVQGLIDADVDAPQGWNLHVANTGTVDCSDVVMGVIDSGIDLDNDGNGTLDSADGPGAGGDFGNAAGHNYWNGPGGARGYWTGTFPPMAGGLAPGDVLQDLVGHGTAVASILAARGDNGMGIAGICWRAQVLTFNDRQPLVGGGRTQASDSLAVALAVLLRVSGVNLRVVNISGGSPVSMPIMAMAIKAAEVADILVVTSAGNRTINLDAPPSFRDPCTINRTLAALPAAVQAYLTTVTGSATANNLLCVAASTHADDLVGTSNRGATSVHLAAPGGPPRGGATPRCLALAIGGELTSFGQTSAATPHVTGIATLGWSVGGPFAALSAVQMKEQILRFVDLKPAFAATTVSGGRLRWPLTGDFGDLVPGGPAPPCGYETVSRETTLLRGLAPSLCRGPVHLDTGNEWLGETRQPPDGPHKVSNEHNAHAPAPIDEDGVTNLPARDSLDDGLLGFIRIRGVFHARLRICSDHFGASDLFGGRYGAAAPRRLYLNGFFDLNANSRWDLPREHVVHEAIDPTVPEPTHADAFPVLPGAPPFPPQERCLVATVPAPPGPGFPMRWRLDYGEDVGTPPPKAFAPFSYRQPAAGDALGGLDPNWPADRPLSIALHGEVEDYLAHFVELHLIYPGETVHGAPVDTASFPGSPPYSFEAVAAGRESSDGIVNDDLPPGLLIDSVNGALSGTPSPSQSVYHVLCAVYDAEGRPVAHLWWILVVVDDTIPHLEVTEVVTVGRPVDTGPFDVRQLTGEGPFKFFTLPAGAEVGGMVAQAPPDDLRVDEDNGALTGFLRRHAPPARVLNLIADATTWTPVAFLWRTVVPIVDCNHNGVDDPVDVAVGTSLDVNGNRIPDECEINTVSCLLKGTAQGGTASVTVSGFFADCALGALATPPGTSAATVAADLAAAISVDACLSGQGITASAAAGRLRVTGFALYPADVVITLSDPGLEVEYSVVKIPTLSPWGLGLVTLLLSLLGLLLLRRRRRAAP